MAGEWSNLKEVARTLDVHYMTAYRYVRQGRLPATWVDNGWQVHRDDIDAFRTGVVTTESTTDSGTVDWAARLAPMLLNGDESGAWSVMEAAMSAGVDARDCYLTVLSGALVELGDCWGEGTDDDLVDQRLATATALRIVSRLGARFTRPGRRKGTVVLGAPLGENHTLPVAIAADLIRLAGFTVLELGADVTAATFVAAAQRARRLVAVGVSLTTPEGLDAAIEVRRRLGDELPGVAVLIGGQAVGNPEVASMLGSAGWAANGADLVDVLDELARARR
ncbi:MAG: cobalamin-dependent protein [Acidimicrobiales bacterium]